MEIDASIETDRRASSYEKSRVQNLRTAVTDAIIRVRDYGYEPDTSRISVALTALQHSFVRRDNRTLIVPIISRFNVNTVL